MNVHRAATYIARLPPIRRLGIYAAHWCFYQHVVSSFSVIESRVRAFKEGAILQEIFVTFAKR